MSYKKGVDYFPLDVHVDEKIRLLKARFGLEGYAVLILLYQYIYSEGYWCLWTDDTALLFADENRIDPAKLNEIIQECCKRNILNQELYEKHQILTSRGIQERYFNITRKRKNQEIDAEYILIDEILQQTDGINSKMDGILPQNDGRRTEFYPKMSEGGRKADGILPQNVGRRTEVFNKVKESKVKESKGGIKHPRDGCDFIDISDEDYSKLVFKWGKTPTDKLIQKIDNYIGSTGRKYKSHYHVVNSWALKDGLEPVNHKAAEELKTQITKSDEALKAELASKMPEKKLSNDEILAMLPEHLKKTFKATFKEVGA